ncbi:hypothetical protein TNCV_785271 [Trichonephila clavipes]|nr:hypothetical protein TNCV_785271 [Trichonephila clavipes]
MTRYLDHSATVAASYSGKPMNRATTIYSPLSKVYIEVFFTDVNSVIWRSPRDAGTAMQRRRNMCCVKKLVSRICCKKRSDIPYRTKDSSESTVQ